MKDTELRGTVSMAVMKDNISSNSTGINKYRSILMEGEICNKYTILVMELASDHTDKVFWPIPILFLCL